MELRRVGDLGWSADEWHRGRIHAIGNRPAKQTPLGLAVKDQIPRTVLQDRVRRVGEAARIHRFARLLGLEIDNC